MSLLGRFKKKPRRRALVVGLDGVPYSLLQNLKMRKLIPNMASIFENGFFGKMSVCIPEISSVSWSSFMTGTQSGKHGIFGFLDLEPSSYRICFPNYLDLKAHTLWDELAVQNKKSVIINMPATYPAREHNGALVSGFVAIDINKAVYPKTYLNEIIKMGYLIDIDTIKARHDYDFLFKDLYRTLKGRKKAAELFWEEIDWDLFIIVVTGTDRLMHYLWNAYEDSTHQYHKAFLDYFMKVDEFIGGLYDRFLDMKESKENDHQFFMLSDHGFTMIKSEVYLNQWLQENGFLRFAKSNPETIMDIGEGSRAFTMDPSRVYINSKDKFPLGVVEKHDYERLRKEIKEGLEELICSDGDYIAKKVYLKEELYKGPLFDHAPDLIVLSRHGYDLKGKVNTDRIFGQTDLTGMHTQDDAFFYSRNAQRCDSIFNIKDIILNSIL